MSVPGVVDLELDWYITRDTNNDTYGLRWSNLFNWWCGATVVVATATVAVAAIEGGGDLDGVEVAAMVVLAVVAAATVVADGGAGSAKRGSEG
ncbi:hypothetical protein Tco_0420371 [Tanacetum coccineum]